jgi:ethanolamine ammonia-lyase small subunit
MTDSPTPRDPWSALRALTSARIGLARAGASLATAPFLALRLAESRALRPISRHSPARRSPSPAPPMIAGPT